MKRLVMAGLCLAVASPHANGQINAGEQKPELGLPLNTAQVTTLPLPWRIAFLPDGRMLITEKVGGMVLLTQQGAKMPVANLPASFYKSSIGFADPRGMKSLDRSHICLLSSLI